MSIWKKNLSPKSYDLPAMHKTGKVSFGKLIANVHSCKKVCVYFKSSKVEFLIGTSLALNLIRKLRSTASNKLKFLCFSQFFCKFTNKKKRNLQFKTVFNHSLCWLCIILFKYWILIKILIKTAMRYMYRLH